MATRLRAAELEVLFTANTDDVPRAEKVIKTAKDKVEKNPITQKVDADTKGAVDRMKDVENAQKRIVTAKTITTVDANISRAEKNFMRLYERVDYLRSVQPELDVDADITRAVKQMERAQKQLDGLRGARAVMEVDADTSPLEEATDGVGEAAGDKVGSGVEKSLVAALTAIPIAGGIILGAKAIGEALIGGIQAGMQIEVRQDRLQALAGLGEADARRFGLVAGEAYANNFGESVESNMNTARLGLQFGIIDPTTTTRDAKRIVQGLAGISDVLEEDVKPTATAVATLLRTGLVQTADQAYDLLATGAREGLNRNEDLLDTLTEYPVVLRKLGLSGADSLGLINQGLKAGARNTDVLADALKEFQIRATDGSKSSTTGFERLGLDATEMTSRIARGGADARAGLDEVLRKLREMEDPVQRNAAAVELFGTKAEDLGDALFSLDLSTAAEQLGQVNGAAQRMFDTLNDNDASKMEQAKRNVEVAIEGIQGALATGFAQPLTEAAEWVSQNRGPVLQFFRDMALGAIDFAETATNGIATFVSGPLAEMVDGIAGVIDFFNGAEGRPAELDNLANKMRDLEGFAAANADSFGQARDKINEYLEPAIKLGYVADAANRTAAAVGELGSEHGTLDQQMRATVDALNEELTAAAQAGEAQTDLRNRYNDTTQALVDQLVQMGYTEQDARNLIETYGAVPGMVDTIFNVQASAAIEATRAFVEALNNIPGQRDVVINQVVRETGAPRGQVGAAYNAAGAILQPMALGGLTPMRPLAQMVPPSTYRVVGDRHDVSELYAPLDGSPRSWALLMEGFRRMPGVAPMADGGVTDSPAGVAPINLGPIDARTTLSPAEAELRELIIRVIKEYNRDRFARGGS